MRYAKIFSDKLAQGCIYQYDNRINNQYNNDINDLTMQIQKYEIMIAKLQEKIQRLEEIIEKN